MAEEKNDIPKDAAANLQQAAKTLSEVAGRLEGAFSKGTDFAKGLSGEFSKSAKNAESLEDLMGNTEKLLQSIKDEKEKVTLQDKTQSMALQAQNSIAIMTLRLEQKSAIEKARALGASKEQLNEIKASFMEMMDQTRELEAQIEKQEESAQLAQEIESHQEALKDQLKEITGYQGVFSDIFRDGQLAAAVFGAQVLKGFKGTKDLFDHARHEGHTISQAFHETGLAISDSFSLTGTSAKDSMEVMSGMRSEMGNIHEVTREARLEAASLARTYGISNEEAGKLTAQLNMMPNSTMESANNTAEFAGNLAKAADVAPGEVLKDMAKNQEAFAKYGKDGGKNMASMAVAAKKIGMEMGPLVSMTENLLDFENSIEKQMEASVLLGKEINLDKARQLALEGDMAGATKEVLANVGGEAEFNKMNAIQRKALADAMGVNVADLQKMVKNQDELNDLTAEQQEALAAGETTMDELAANAGGLFDKLKNVAVTAFSLVKGFGTIASTMNNALDLAKKFGIESFKDLKNIIAKGAAKGMQYARDIAHWAKEKAHELWKMATQKGYLKEQAKGLADRAKGLASKAKDKVQGGMEKLAGGATEKIQDAAKSKGGGMVEKVADTGATDKAGDMADKADKVKKPKSFKEAMAGIRDGIQEFAKGAAKTLKGVGVMVLAGVMLGAGLLAITMGIKAAGGSPKDLMMVGIALAAFAGSLYLMSKTMGEMKLTDILKGSLALGLLGAALIPAAVAFSLLKGIDIGSIIAFSIALPLLGLAAAGLGLLLVPIGMGAAALALLGVGMIAVAAAFLIFQAGQKGMDSFISFLGELKPEMAIGLLATAAAMFPFALALGVFAVAAYFATPAMIALGAGMLVLGAGVAMAATGLAAISEVLPTLADGFTQMGLAVPGLMALSAALLVATPALLVFAVAAPVATVGAIMLGAGMMILGAGVTVAAAGMALIAGVLPVIADGFAGMAESLTMIVSFLPAMFMMGTALFGMAAGLTAFAFAGILTLPTIMGLMALSLVAPILIALGDSINFDLGGGSSVEEKPEDDKMDQLINEVRSLKAVMSQGGVINMDGTKVGDVLRLSMTNAGVE